MRLRVASLEREVAAHIRPVLLLLTATGVLLLLVACANAAALLLVRFMARRQDIAVRRALGATPRQLTRPLLLESALVAFGGTLAGMLLAHPALSLLMGLEPGIVPRTGTLDIDAPMLLASIGLAFAITLACGLAPALLATRGELPTMLRAPRSTARGAQRLRHTVVLLQTAISFALLYSTASLVGTLARIERADVGFTGDDVMTARVTLPFARYRGPDVWIRTFDEFADALRRTPGVNDAALASDLPMDGDLTLEPYAAAGATGEWGATTSLYRIVTPGWFAAASVPLRAGRDFDNTDRAGATNALIVDEALAATLTGGAPAQALGRQLTVTVHEFRDGYRVTQRTGEVVGVVGTVAHEHPDAPPPGTIYMPHAQYPLWSMVATVRGAGAAPDVALIRNTLDGIDRQLPLSSVRALNEVIDQLLAPTRFVLALIGILAAAVLALTAAGLFGVVAESVRQRRREFGIRLAVGATPAALSRRTLGTGVALAALGMVPGVLLAPVIGRMVARGVTGASVFAPAAFVAAAVALLLISAAACFLPAWRAGRVDPLTTLREE